MPMPMPSRGSRMSSGLAPRRHLLAHGAYASVEHLIVDDDAPPPEPSPRASRKRRPELSYDQKFHPMDVVTRPNMPATQRHRSKSVSFADDQDDESDTESQVPSSSQAASDSDGSDDEAGADPVSRRAPPPAKRKQDSQASRHSSRKEAQKFVDYDRKSHPSDYGIPGYQHKAKYTPPADKTPPVRNAKKRKLASRGPDDEDDDPLPVQARHRRKQLKSLATNKPDSATKRGTNSSDEVNALLEEATRGSRRAPLLVSSLADSDVLEEDIDLVFGYKRERVPDAGRSSNTLDVSPQETPDTPLASSHKIPEYIHHRHALRHGSSPLTTDAAFGMLLEDYRINPDAKLIVIRPYIGPASSQDDVEPQAGAESPGHSTPTVGREVPDSEGSSPRDADADEDEDDEDEDDLEVHSSQNQNYFTEQLAITEPRESDGCDDLILPTLPLLSSDGDGYVTFGGDDRWPEVPVHEVGLYAESTQ